MNQAFAARVLPRYACEKYTVLYLELTSLSHYYLHLSCNRIAALHWTILYCPCCMADDNAFCFI